MQKTLWIASLLVLACLVPCYASPSWQLQVNASAETILYDVCAISDTVVCAVGTSGVFSKSTDRGITWTTTVASLAANTYYGVSFPSSAVGYIAGTNNNGYGLILKTSNGGTTWDQIYSITNCPIFYDLYFATDTRGWAVGQSDRIYKTNDGGASWTTGEPAPTPVTKLLAVHAKPNGNAAPDDYNVWTVGTGGKIYFSDTGGAGIAEQTSGVATSLIDVYFTDKDTGWIVGDNGVILKTTNAGTSWGSQASGLTSMLTSCHFVDSANGWAVGSAGKILSTTNGGTTWSDFTSPTTSDLHGISFYNAYNGWAVGGGSRVALKYGGAVISTVSPATGYLGDTLTLTITGQNFVSGATVAFSGSGITVNSATVNSSTQMTVSITIASGASTGARNITVTNPDNIASTMIGGFASQSRTVINPVITSFNPNYMRQGETGTVLINGLNYENNATVVVDGITVNSVTFNSSTQLQVSLTVPLTKPIGLYSVTVTNPSGGVVVSSGGFRVIAQNASRPTVTSSVSSYLFRGNQRNITINGTNFQDGAVIRVYPETQDLTVNAANTRFISASQISIDLTAAANAALALYTFELSNPDGGMALGENILEVKQEAAAADPQIQNLRVGPSPIRLPSQTNVRIGFDVTRGPFPFSVKIPIMDMAGRLIAVFDRVYSSAGYYTVDFNLNQDTILREMPANGMYLIKVADARTKLMIAR